LLHESIQFQVRITHGEVNSFVFGYRDEIIQAKGFPKKSGVCRYRECASNEPFRIAMNMNVLRAVDLNSFSIWMKSAFQTGKIGRRDELWHRPPCATSRDMIHHGISRKENQISAISCASAAGESLTPEIITSQDSPTVCEKLKKYGVRFGTDLTMKSNAKPYINVEIFLDYVRTVLLPNLGEFRGLDEFAEEMPM
jgi:hypothetical protein